MTEKNITTKVQVLAYNELNQEDKKLVDLAKEATKSSYAPYSHFNVSLAIYSITHTGITVTVRKPPARVWNTPLESWN